MKFIELTQVFPNPNASEAKVSVQPEKIVMMRRIKGPQEDSFKEDVTLIWFTGIMTSFHCKETIDEIYKKIKETD